MKKIRPIPAKFVLSLFWTLLIAGAGVWTLSISKENHRNQLLTTARSNFNLIVTSRAWNAAFGGIYVPVTEKSQPNPYLETANRDILLPDGQELTLINPAYMTRMISELSTDQEDVSFHITSLNPIRPQNRAKEWEVEALQSFRQDLSSEFYFYDSKNHRFYYMAPLVTKNECLQCHQKQGYQIGEIRGGISVSFTSAPFKSWPIITSLSVIGLTGFLGIFLYSTNLDTRMDVLHLQAHQDGLTGIANRAHFEFMFKREYLRARRNHSPLSIIFCDIDFFKQYNDQYGHQSGDLILQKTASRLKNTLNRPGDIIARYGGEEFIALLPDTDQEGACFLAERMRKSIEDLHLPHHKSEISPWLTISAGVWTYRGEEMNPRTIIKNADQALYQAKENGRNQVCCFE